MLDERKVLTLLQYLGKMAISTQRDAMALEIALLESGVITYQKINAARDSVDERLERTSEKLHGEETAERLAALLREFEGPPQ